MGPRHNTRAGRSTQTLREAILSLRLVPGTRLVEREMVDRLGVSRTGVRAALQSLEAEGLVVRGHRSVFSVAVVSREEARQIYEVRAALEPAMARLFIARASDEQVAALGEAAAHAEAAARALDGAAYVETFRQRQRNRPAHPGDAGSAHRLSAASDDAEGAPGSSVAHGGAAARHLHSGAEARARPGREALCRLRRALRAVRHGGAEGQWLNGARALFRCHCALVRSQGGANRRNHLGSQPTHAFARRRMRQTPASTAALASSTDPI
jgi:DNA-binding transcriptional regulator YhcF (GntR family)